MKTKKKGKKKGAPTVWEDSFYVKTFQLAQQGLTDEGIAAGLGVHFRTFRLWKKKRPALKEAITAARKPASAPIDTFKDYVYEQLPSDLKDLWQDIQACSVEGNPNAVARMEKMLSDAGKTARQHLFIHALIANNFNFTAACKAVNIGKKQFDTWLLSDPGFARLIDEMDWHKKNFFESKLFELVAAGDGNIVKFVNQTYNADRGYGNVKTINKNVNVTGTVRTAAVSVDELDLTVEQKKALLAKIRGEEGQ